MSTSLIPLTPEPQRFSITLAGREYLMRVSYRNAPMTGWILDIGELDGTPILCGVPLIPMVDLLAQYAYLGIRGQMWLVSDGDPTHTPKFDELGQSSRLYFVDAA